MALINGTLVLIKTGASGAATSALAHIENCTWDSSFDPAEATTKDSGGYQEFGEETGLRSATISVNGKADVAATTGNVAKLIAEIASRENVAFVFGPAGAGNINFTGNALTTNLSISADNETWATFTGTLTVNGAWTVTTGS